MFEGKLFITTPVIETDEAATTLVEQAWQRLGSRTERPAIPGMQQQMEERIQSGRYLWFRWLAGELSGSGDGINKAAAF